MKVDSDLDLWPDDISVDIVTPLAILRAQVGPLQKKTKGLLRVNVSTQTSSEGDSVIHKMDLVAPALGNYRQEILSVTHTKDRVYPVQIEAECLATSVGDDESGYVDFKRQADTEQEFIRLLGEVLRSGPVRAVIHSLLARMNEQTAEGSGDAPATR